MSLVFNLAFAFSWQTACSVWLRNPSYQFLKFTIHPLSDFTWLADSTIEKGLALVSGDCYSLRQKAQRSEMQLFVRAGWWKYSLLLSCYVEHGTGLSSMHLFFFLTCLILWWVHWNMPFDSCLFSSESSGRGCLWVSTSEMHRTVLWFCQGDEREVSQSGGNTF